MTTVPHPASTRARVEALTACVEELQQNGGGGGGGGGSSVVPLTREDLTITVPGPNTGEDSWYGSGSYAEFHEVTTGVTQQLHLFPPYDPQAPNPYTYGTGGDTEYVDPYNSYFRAYDGEGDYEIDIYGPLTTDAQTVMDWLLIDASSNDPADGSVDSIQYVYGGKHRYVDVVAGERYLVAFTHWSGTEGDQMAVGNVLQQFTRGPQELVEDSDYEVSAEGYVEAKAPWFPPLNNPTAGLRMPFLDTDSTGQRVSWRSPMDTLMPMIADRHPEVVTPQPNGVVWGFEWHTGEDAVTLETGQVIFDLSDWYGLFVQDPDTGVITVNGGVWPVNGLWNVRGLLTINDNDIGADHDVNLAIIDGGFAFLRSPVYPARTVTESSPLRHIPINETVLLLNTNLIWTVSVGNAPDGDSSFGAIPISLSLDFRKITL